MMTYDSRLGSLCPPRLDRVTGRDLLEYFQNTWKLYDWLFQSVIDEKAYFSKSDPLRHPLIFYLGHTAAFYNNKLFQAGLLEQSSTPHFDRLFARGVDPESARDLENRSDWPTLEKVRNYRNEVYQRVGEFIAQLKVEQTIDGQDPLWALLMALEHDRIHFETSSVLIRQYPVKALSRMDSWQYAPMNFSDPDWEMVPIEGGRIELGKSSAFPTFGWDNEYGHQEIGVAPFEAAVNLVTNAEFMGFVQAGGYQNPQWWSPEGQKWLASSGSKHPRFWQKSGSNWLYRAMFDLLDMPLDWPVEVNAFEAEAWCRFKGEGLRLPTEAEFQAMVAGTVSDEADVMEQDLFNLNMKYGSPHAVGSLPGAISPSGIRDPYGNVWQWLANDFTPLPGFQAHPFYQDFSEPYFDSQHAMLLGGAWASSGTSASRFYRLWFRRHFYQHAGFRPVRSL